MMLLGAFFSVSFLLTEPQAILKDPPCPPRASPSPAPSPISGPRGPPEQQGLCQQQPQPATQAAPGPGTGKVPTLLLRHRAVRLQGPTTASCKQPDRVSSPGSSHLHGAPGLPLCWQRQVLREKTLGHSEELTASRKSRKGMLLSSLPRSSAAPGGPANQSSDADTQRRSSSGASSQEAASPAPASPGRLA